MRSSVPKVLHEVCGRPMIAWPILAAREAGAERVCVIVSPDRDLSPVLPEGPRRSSSPRPTAPAARSAPAWTSSASRETVLVLSGDHPLVSAEIISELLETHRDAGAAATVMTTELEDPGSYGRIVRGPTGTRSSGSSRPRSPATRPSRSSQIKEVNAGTYAFAGGPLAEALGRISNDNAQGEYYLGDVLPLLREAVHGRRLPRSRPRGQPGGQRSGRPRSGAEEARRRILVDHMRAGVTVEDPGSTWIDADVVLEPDVTILPGDDAAGCDRRRRRLRGRPNDHPDRLPAGEAATVPHSYLTGCEVG